MKFQLLTILVVVTLCTINCQATWTFDGFNCTDTNNNPTDANDYLNSFGVVMATWLNAGVEDQNQCYTLSVHLAGNYGLESNTWGENQNLEYMKCGYEVDCCGNTGYTCPVPAWNCTGHGPGFLKDEPLEHDKTCGQQVAEIISMIDIPSNADYITYLTGQIDTVCCGGLSEPFCLDNNNWTPDRYNISTDPTDEYAPDCIGMFHAYQSSPGPILETFLPVCCNEVYPWKTEDEVWAAVGAQVNSDDFVAPTCTAGSFSDEGQFESWDMNCTFVAYWQAALTPIYDDLSEFYKGLADDISTGYADNCCVQNGVETTEAPAEEEETMDMMILGAAAVGGFVVILGIAYCFCIKSD